MEKSSFCVDWRGLFDHLRIPWRDQGPNTSRDNVNVPCPFCKDDPSFHLSVAEFREAYYCYRNPSLHSGRNLIRLLRQFGIMRAEAINLLNSFNRPDRLRHQKAEAPPMELPLIAKRWSRFRPAYESPACIKYLRQRGFPDPELVIEQFDLRYAPSGTWAQRLLIPFDDENGLASWTGRALDKRFEPPKYKNYDTGITGLLYAPRIPQRVAVTVEGPLDALKINAAFEGQGISAIALTGLALNDIRLHRYLRLLRHAKLHLIALDADVSTSVSLRITKELASLLKSGYTRRIPLPPGRKDAGEMELSEIRQWISLNYLDASP